MTNKELNVWLHEHILGECWHEIVQKGKDRTRTDERAECRKCGGLFSYCPNYCESLDAVAKVEAAVVNGMVAGSEKLQIKLMELHEGTDFCFASSRHRAEACKEAWKKSEPNFTDSDRPAFESWIENKERGVKTFDTPTDGSLWIEDRERRG